MFASSPDVVFGDVNLSEQPIRSSDLTGSLSPGMGGWPTVRYFNKETGYAGAPYEKQTPMAMCEELGMGQPYLENFVEDKGNTASCDAFSKVGCVDKQKAFIDKWVDRPLEETTLELARLEKMRSGSMKGELQEWMRQRMAILKQLATRKSSRGDEL
mmetsp:Transcript_10288/g.37891  ORF Transcript_10288/g.37891 Transcript_10288/m.37891 type:complete len:157 (+) Transcript_10288:330-800(+)